MSTLRSFIKLRSLAKCSVDIVARVRGLVREKYRFGAACKGSLRNVLASLNTIDLIPAAYTGRDVYVCKIDVGSCGNLRL